MSEVDSERAVYSQIALSARQATMASLQLILGEFSLTEWSGRVFTSMWPEPAFPWERISETYRDPDRLEIAIWSGQRLVGMAIGRSDGDNIVLEFIEGDPANASPLKGFRTLIALDVAANYAQARGKHRLLVQPMNSGLVDHYKKFGFSTFPPNTGSPYMWKKV